MNKNNTNLLLSTYKDFKKQEEKKKMEKQHEELKESNVQFEDFRVAFKKMDVNAKTPTKGSADAAGFDLYSIETTILKPGMTAKVHTGISIAIPQGCFGGIFARSGLATKQGLAPINCVGIIDADYRGELIVALHNHSSVTQKIELGDRIAQLIIIPYLKTQLIELDELDDTERGEGGFGSTGTK